MDCPLVSVVLPIYNVERYLERCILSVVNQTYRHLEIILVDDASPDRCPQLCDAWAQKDPRIKVIHKENAGLGYARNTGIDHATGEYICFFDSDDYIEPNTIEDCICAAVGEKADLVCFGNDIVSGNGILLGTRIPKPPKYIYEGDEIKSVMMPNALSYNADSGEDWNFSLSACFCMYSTQVIRNSGWRFVSERQFISEDIYSVLQFYQYVRKAVILPAVYYHYIVNPVSLSHSYRQDKYDKLVFLAEKLTELSDEMGCRQVLQPRIPRIFLGLTIGVLKQVVAQDQPISWKRAELLRIIKDPYMCRVFAEHDFSKEESGKRMLFWAMKRKWPMICYGIVKVKNLMEKA